MIVDITISNFRSIRKEQTFSLHSETPGSHLTENISYPGDGKHGILKSAGIYGANASGKSNLLLAFEALRYIACESGDLKEGEKIPCYDPYLLCKSSNEFPVHFEIEFYTPSNVRHRYMVSYLQNKIINESLLYYPSSQPAIVFERNENETWKDIRFGGKYKGGKRRIPFFDNNAYLSKAGNSADAPEMIREVYNYFRKEMLQLNVDERARKLNWVEDETLLKKVSALLRLVDTGIAGIEVKELEKVNSINLPEGIPEEFKEAILKDIRKKFLFTHISEEGKEVAFNERKESAGTRKLFHLAPLILDALKGGAILIIDELDNSMHPFMAELIIKLFNDPRVNKNNAQLIFSTHNINLMTSKSLRRDQIWFTEKKDGSTTFYSLDDFDKNKVKPQSPFNQWYAEGRFGAVPMIDYNSIVELLSEDGD